MLKQELYSRKNNLKICGLPETSLDRLEDKILHLLQGVGITINPRDVDRVHYIGPVLRNRSRSIIIRFLFSKDKTAVLMKRDLLKQKGITLSEDYPQEIQERRRLILPIFFKALKDFPQLKPKLRTDRLILAGRTYDIHNIKSIPVKELQPELIFTREQQGVTAFYSKHSPLSNHFPSDFTENNVKFKSAEQCFMHKKALHFKDHEAAQRILEATTAAEAKQIGGHIQGFNSKEWRQVSQD